MDPAVPRLGRRAQLRRSHAGRIRAIGDAELQATHRSCSVGLTASAAALPPPQVLQAADEACAALAAHLGSRPYFGGDKPNSLDAAAFPMLCFALSAPVVR